MKNIHRRLQNFALMALSALLLAGCASQKPALQPLPAAQPIASTRTTLGPGDVIDIKFAYASQFNESQTARPDGKIVLHLIGPITVQGKTPDELREEIEVLYADQLKHQSQGTFSNYFQSGGVGRVSF